MTTQLFLPLLGGLTVGKDCGMLPSLYSMTFPQKLPVTCYNTLDTQNCSHQDIIPLEVQ